jgi:hypothetical protein
LGWVRLCVRVCDRAISGEEAHTNCIVFGLTLPGLELTIYRTRGEHTIFHTTDAFITWILNKTMSSDL